MNRLAGQRVLVTGGAGFIGSHLVERLVAESPGRLVVLDDLSTGTLENLATVAKEVELEQGDVGDPDPAGLAADADLVFHLAVRNVRASIRAPAENFRVNAGGTLAILEAMRLGRRGRFIYVSSSEVYGVPASGRYAEDSLPAPTTVYGAGKLAGELVTLAYGRSYGADVRVIRPFNNYGPRSHFEGDSGEVIPKFILRALAGHPLVVHGDGTQTRDFMYVEETARWLLELSQVDSLCGQVVNMGSGREVSINKLAELVRRLLDSGSEIVHDEPRPGDLPRLIADCSKLRGHVPFELRTGLEQGLRATAECFSGADLEALLEREVARNWT